MIMLSEEKVFTADAAVINTSVLKRPCGELLEDFYVVPVRMGDGTVKNHLVQSGRFYIRDSHIETNENGCTERYTDILIDPTTLEDVTDPMNPIFVGCDLAHELDVAYYNGEYYTNEIRKKNS